MHRSRYLQAGSPKNCSNPACQKPLERTAWRCEDAFFCDEACALEAANVGLRRIERFAPVVN
jgi:hypothetical protein